MVNSIWIAVAIILIAVIFILKFSSKKQNLIIKLCVVLFVFLLVSGAYVYTKNNLVLSNLDGLTYAGKVYLSWLSNVFDNIGKSTGYLINKIGPHPQFQHKMKITIVLIKFLFLGALFIISNNMLYLSHSEDRHIFFDMYYNWLDNLFGNTLRLSGYLIHFEWLPSTNITQLDEIQKDSDLKEEYYILTP